MSPETFTLANLFSMELHNYQDTIAEIVTSAMKELSIERVRQCSLRETFCCLSFVRLLTKFAVLCFCSDFLLVCGFVRWFVCLFVFCMYVSWLVGWWFVRVFLPFYPLLSFYHQSINYYRVFHVRCLLKNRHISAP